MKRFFPHSPVPPDSPAYVERPADLKVRYLVLKGTPVYLSGPPLTGKTSLLLRLGCLLLSEGFSFFYVRLEPESPPDMLEAFLKDRPQVDGRLLLLVDDLENGGDAALAVLRSWIRHNPGIPLVAAGSLYLYPHEISPLVEINLGFFYKPHIMQLVGLLDLGEKETREIAESLYRWSGGYPYIAQNLCAALAEGRNVDEAVEDFIRRDKSLLPKLKEILSVSPEACDLYHRILKGEPVNYRQVVPLLRKSPFLRALVRSDERGLARLSSPILRHLMQSQARF